MPPVTLMIVGAGDRGFMYAGYAAKFPNEAKVVAVAEPRAAYRARLAEQHGIRPQFVLSDWREAATRGRLADAVVIATPDAMHAEPAVAFAWLDYRILLEKPMAVTEADCRRVVGAVQEAGVVFALGHVLRYTAYTRRIKAMIDAGAVGEVVSIQHLEPVGYWHQAHSFVRGNWRNSQQSSFMLLAKSCHDLDWIRHIMGAPCRRVSSFGSLRHFRREFAPAGSADRCLDCQVESTCPYSAARFYLGAVERGNTGWPVSVLTMDVTKEGVTKALREGPYGRCVYRCDNDVVDNQVVNMEFEGGRTATFTMTAFNPGGDRKTRIFGTRGYIEGDGATIHHFDFLTNKTETIHAAAEGAVKSGHGGGDYALAHAFLSAVAADAPGKVLSGPVESLETHLMVFAAERSRLEGRVVDITMAS